MGRHRGALAFAAAVREGEFTGAERAYGTASGAVRALGVRALTGADVDVVERWCAARPDSAPAQVALGACRIDAAWEVRGTGLAESVSRAAWERFHEGLRRAEAGLERGAKLDPADATPWTLLLRSGRGLEIPVEELRLRFEQATRRDPGLCVAHDEMLQALAQKWFGSHEEMFAFARGVADGAADGSPLHALVAVAHQERWVLEEEGRFGAEYFVGEVLAEVTAAAQRSVLLPGFPDPAEDPDAMWAMNVFALPLWFGGAREWSASLMGRLGDHLTEAPWWYVADEADVIAAARAGET